MFITPAYAQTANAAAASPLAGIFQFLSLFLIGAVFYFLLIRPQQTQQKQLRSRLDTLKRGDRIVTAGGIIATVKKAADKAENIDVEIAPNVVVSVVRSTITSVVTEAAAANDKS